MLSSPQCQQLSTWHRYVLGPLQAYRVCPQAFCPNRVPSSSPPCGTSRPDPQPPKPKGSRKGCALLSGEELEAGSWGDGNREPSGSTPANLHPQHKGLGAPLEGCSPHHHKPHISSAAFFQLPCSPRSSRAQAPSPKNQTEAAQAPALASASQLPPSLPAPSLPGSPEPGKPKC